ncbi:MAG: hypothetical protein VX017_11040, partial [Pseudomonadota bacterium]|nr:hypothetical protein [Pseudomonadota bacterium]
MNVAPTRSDDAPGARAAETPPRKAAGAAFQHGPSPSCTGRWPLLGKRAITDEAFTDGSRVYFALNPHEPALEAAERQHRDECGAGRQRIAALQKALEEQQVQRSQERTQAAAQQRVLAAQLQELRAAEAELRAQVGHL